MALTVDGDDGGALGEEASDDDGAALVVLDGQGFPEGKLVYPRRIRRLLGSRPLMSSLSRTRSSSAGSSAAPERSGRRRGRR
jgi:hypothetical protein